MDTINMLSYLLSVVAALAERCVMSAFHGAVVIGHPVQLVDAVPHLHTLPFQGRNVLGHIESGQRELYKILLLCVPIAVRLEIDVKSVLAQTNFY